MATKHTMTKKLPNEILTELAQASAMGAIFNELTNELYVINADTLDIEYANGAATNNLGYSQKALCRLNVSDIKPEFKVSLFESIVKQLRADPSDKRVFSTLQLRENRTIYPVFEQWQLFKLDHRDVIVAVASDISEIEESKAESQAILDTTVDAIINIGKTGNILHFNKAAEQMFGYQRDDVIGRNINIIMPEPEARNHNGYLHGYMKTGERKIIGVGREVFAKRKDGTIFPIDLSVAELTVNGEKRFTGILRDLSEVKEAEQNIHARESELKTLRDQLAHIDRLHIVDEMTTGIAHELNQPLTAIANYSKACQRLLQQENLDTDKLIEINQKINQQTQRAGQVVHRLRALVKKDHINYQAIDPTDVINDVLELIQTDSRINDIDINTEIECNKIQVEVDTVQIGQVLINLIRNAIDSLTESPPPETMQITVAARCQKDWVEFSVSDNGEGIPESNFDQVFEPFFTSKTSGMGMGLSICRSIIKSHGGELDFRKVDPHGVEFYFSLPASASNK